jgi:hypothetical protein
MLTKMTEEDWVLALEVFHACRSGRVRLLEQHLEALLSLSRSGVFETFFEALASLSERAHLVQMSTVVRAHVYDLEASAGGVAGRGCRPVRARRLGRWRLAESPIFRWNQPPTTSSTDR